MEFFAGTAGKPDLNAALIDGDRFHNIKDLLLHVIDIEDHWVHVIARGDGLEASAFKHDWVKPQAEQYQLSWIWITARGCSGAPSSFWKPPRI